VKPVHMDESMFAKVDTYFDVTQRAASLPGPCPTCTATCDTRMCVVDVPFFKDIILMVTQCDRCGYKDSEVKPAGEVGAQGIKVTLEVKSVEDLKRDLLKSDAASCVIPELELELQPGTLGGKYTTLVRAASGFLPFCAPPLPLRCLWALCSRYLSHLCSVACLSLRAAWMSRRVCSTTSKRPLLASTRSRSATVRAMPLCVLCSVAISHGCVCVWVQVRLRRPNRRWRSLWSA
jgi:hypothetical protein